MTDEILPFCIAGVRVGSVENVTTLAGCKRGVLLLEGDRSGDVTEIESLLLLARQVDDAPSVEYLAAWNAWRIECDKTRDVGIWIGNSEQPVEEFSIESDWSIEWEDALPDDFFLKE